MNWECMELKFNWACDAATKQTRSGMRTQLDSGPINMPWDDAAVAV